MTSKGDWNMAVLPGLAQQPSHGQAVCMVLSRRSSAQLRAQPPRLFPTGRITNSLSLRDGLVPAETTGGEGEGGCFDSSC